MATPSLAMIPSAYADAKVFSVLPNNGDGDFTFNRDSSATRIGQNGLIQTVGYFSSEKVVNGTFDTNSDWSVGSGWTISGGKANVNSTSLADMSQDIGSSTGKTYKITFEVSNYVSGSVKVLLGYGSTPVSPALTASANGIYEVEATPNVTNPQRLYISTQTATSNLSIDNISVKEVTGDQPRLNYDISNGVVQSCPSLLLEPASTNLIVQSNQFDTSWSASGVTLQDNQSGVSGGLNAWKITEDTSTAQHFVQLVGSLTAAAEQTVTIYAKAAERNYLMLNQSGVFKAYYDLVNGTVVSIGTGVTASMESMPNGWWRCRYTATMTYTSLRVCVNNDGSSNSYTGDGVSGIYIQYCQNETLSYATSYIPNSGQSAGVTRAAETCFGAGTSSTFNSTEGVLYVEIKTFSESGSAGVISLNDGSNTNRVKIELDGGQIKVRIDTTAGQVASLNYTIAITNYLKIAVKWKADDYALWINGIEGATDTSGASFVAGTLSELSFDRGDGVEDFYGNTKDVRVFNEALTDLQLQKLTTL